MIVSVEGKKIDFPDDMPTAEIEAIIETEFLPKKGLLDKVSMPKDAPAKKPPIREQMKVRKVFAVTPSLVSEEIRKRTLELQREKLYGTISEAPFTFTSMIRNVPRDIKEITNAFSSLIMGSGMFVYSFGKNLIKDTDRYLLTGETDFPKLKKQFKPVVGLGKAAFHDLPEAIIYDWKSIFAGETPEEISSLPIGQAIDVLHKKIEEEGLSKVTLNFIRNNPVDALFFGYALYRVAATGTRLAIEAVDAVIPKATKISSKMDDILSTYRTPIVYNLEAEVGGFASTIKTLEFPRKYAKDPLTKYIFEKSFDAMLDNFPKLKSAVAEHKAKKLLNSMRNLYEDANFTERAAIHKDIFKQINTLSKKEQALVVPYLEGRLSLINEPSEQFVNFENWYRTVVSKIDADLISRGKLTPEIIKNRMYQPIAKATGQTTEQVIGHLGEFKPVYVHHTFPKIYSEKTNIHFAETTGQRFKPGFLKRSKGVEGYSENLKDILPKWTSEYIKYKNTETFIKSFTEKFGIKVNIKNIKEVEGGLLVGGKLYKDYKIIAPDGYLHFYKQKMDFYKEVSKRMDGSTFDEAIGDVLSEISVSKEFIGVAKNRVVYLVPNKMAKELESFAAPFMGSQKAQDVVRLVVDKPSQIWKDSVLALTPRWIKNNVMGDIIFNTFEQVGPLSYSRAFRAIYKDTIPDELLRASFANVMKYNPKLGSTVKTTMGGLVDKLYKTKTVAGIAKIKDTGYAINTMIEQPFVRALYVKLARDKAVKILKTEKLKINEVNILNKMRVIKNNPELVAPLVKKVQETLPVFNLLGNWERKYIRRFMPFYNWYKFMIQYSAKLPKNHPFLLVGARGLSELSENQREQVFKDYFPFMAREIEENGIPERFSHLWPVGEKDQEKATFLNARGLNVFTTIEDFADFDVINMLSPVVTVPYEQITGRAAFGDREFISGEEGIEFTVDGVVYRDFTKVTPPLIDHMFSQFPQYALLKQILVPARQYDTGSILNPDPILDPITGEYKYPIDNIEKILNYMGIDKKTLEIREVWNKYQQRRQQAFGRAGTKYQSKYKSAMSFEEIRGVMGELKKDKVLWKKLQEELKDGILYKREQTKELRKKIKEEEK